MSSSPLLLLMMGNSSMHMTTSELGIFVTENVNLEALQCMFFPILLSWIKTSHSHGVSFAYRIDSLLPVAK